MKPTFYRVQNKTNNDDFTDFDNIEDARKFCEEWALTEDTHQLEMWTPNKKSDHMDVQISFMFHDGKPVRAVIQRPGDDSHINVIGAMANPHAAGKPKTVKEI